jgi:hypothetical protein
MITKKYKLLIIPNPLHLMDMMNYYDAFNLAQCHVDVDILCDPIPLFHKPYETIHKDIQA